ncbi:MAG: EAL domain-containing protein [Methylophaga sp.]|nr:EAL domain-containing protein [Methylophaga sp.]
MSVGTDYLAQARHFELESLVSYISSRLISCDLSSLTDEIQYCLRLLGEHSHSDRCYLLLLSESGEQDQRYQWCSPRVPPISDTYWDDLKALKMPSSPQQTSLVTYFSSAEHSETKAVRDQIDSFISLQAVKSILVVPIIIKKQVLGFLGLDTLHTWRNWGQDESYLLRIAGDIFSHTLQHKKAEDLLRETESRLRYIFDKIPSIAVQGYDDERRVFMWNRASEHLYGYSAEEALGARLEDLIIPHELRDTVIKNIEDWLDRDIEIPSGELQLRHKNGSSVQVFSSHVMFTKISGEKQFYCMDIDLSALKDAQSKLARSAHFDALTGLPNRVLLCERLEQSLRYCKRNDQLLAVAYIDLDGFKEINDLHGHQTGDRVLKEISRRLQNLLQVQDTLARIGGDEFVLVFTHIPDLNSFEVELENLLAIISKPISLEGISLTLSASIGVTIYPGDDALPEQMLRHADQSMQIAKQSDMTKFHIFDVELEKQICRKQAILQSISAGLKTVEFELFYQPKINMRTLEFLGAEALIRWRHPDQGLLSPAHFLPLTTGHPVAVELGDWVLNQALNQIKCWQEMGFDCPVSINVAPELLQNSFFSENLSSALSAFAEVSPRYLELEILESSALEDLDAASGVLTTCNELGVRLSIDDFGTGYSSLMYLKRFPVDCLKIDQGFVRDILTDPNDLSIIQGILGLSKVFGLDVIAEGVETLEHGQRLLSMGCFNGQGYAIAKPMPANELQGWVSETLPKMSFLDEPYAI